ncbi:carbohydrate ABC transporter permease [Bifidobacterium biavatii]|uniref:Binding-protein-dependent transport system inner membrane component n=1 Tax=Bifidobacterium biavatii DSM 23969 TaxID=1437608 RepID=A0A086ZLU2_9BIFI|nr:carbohydrate ABC transporter permease [Bifidobacterium biavatii]KFI47492.1 binding-protein-dependent transport system inner membrane component [Bifidobacterium biavatii DSM 23969]
MQYSKATKIIFFTILAILGVLWMFPIVWAIFTSFKSNDEIISSDFQLLPQHWTLDNYKELTASNEQTPVFKWFLNSLIISSCQTLLVLVVVSLAAYGYTRLQFKGRDALFNFLLATMMFPGVLNLIPNYKIIDTLGWTNTFLAVIVPGAAGVYNIFLVRQFVVGIPHELDEAAIVDGANEWQIFRHVILPLIRPALTVVALFTFTGAWNDFLWPSVVMTDVDTMPITPGLQLLQGQYLTFPGVVTAGSLLALIPMLLLYVFAQKYFMQAMALNSGIK